MDSTHYRNERITVATPDVARDEAYRSTVDVTLALKPSINRCARCPEGRVSGKQYERTAEEYKRTFARTNL